MLEIVIMAGHSILERVELRGQLRVSTTDVAQPDECANDEYAHANRAAAMEHGRRHQRAMLCESPWLGR